MWLATQYGFCSMVRKNQDEFHLRARVRRDLENLREITGVDVEVHVWPAADYRYRMILCKADASAVIAAVFKHLDYANFKSRIVALPDQRGNQTAIIASGMKWPNISLDELACESTAVSFSLVDGSDCPAGRHTSPLARFNAVAPGRNSRTILCLNDRFFRYLLCRS